MARNTSGLRRGGGRPKGVPNKITQAAKDFALAVLDDPEWQASAKARMIAGRAPHLEAHLIAVVVPKTDRTTHDGEIVLRWKGQ